MKNIKRKKGEKFYKLYDEKGNEIGRINPIFEKTQNDWLKGVSIFVLTEDGNLVLEKRTKNTVLTPGDIDLVSGHTDSDEKSKKAGYRELEEELGIKKKRVLKLKKLKTDVPLVFKGKRKFFISFYVTKMKKKFDESNLQETEVQDVMIVPIEDGFELIRNNKTKFPYTGNEEKFEKIFEKVRQYYDKKISKTTEKNDTEQR